MTPNACYSTLAVLSFTQIPAALAALLPQPQEECAALSSGPLQAFPLVVRR